MTTLVPHLSELRRLGRSAARVAGTHYPAFVFGRGVSADELPIFTYHDVDAAELEGDLDFLLSNGYRALSIDEYCDRVRRGSSERCVLLTFDDARASFWEVAFPILKRRGVRAALFVPTYWVGERNVSSRDSTPPGFMTWPQIAECEDSGLIDVESHGHRHTLVYTAPRLAGFVTPVSLRRHDLFDWPMRRERDRDICGRPPLGTPIYESAPLLSATHRYIESPLAATTCRSLVELEGGEAFFTKRSASAQLAAAHAAVAGRVPAARMSAHEFRAQVESEVTLALETFRRELGRKPRYFAFPWRLGSPESLELLADHGVEAAFGVALDFRRLRREPVPLPVHARYKSDWLRLLPGEGRRRIVEVVPRKLASFLRTQHFAH